MKKDIVKTETTIFFNKESFLSSTYICRIKAFGEYFFNLEHLLLYNKALVFKDLKTASKIIKCSDPKDLKSLDSSIKNYTEAIWSKHLYNNTVLCCFYKFRQNKDLKEKLLEFKNHLFMYCNPDDLILSSGTDLNSILVYQTPKNVSSGKGINILGKALNHVINVLSVEEEPIYK